MVVRDDIEDIIEVHQTGEMCSWGCLRSSSGERSARLWIAWRL